MGDAAGQHAQALQPLPLAQLVLQPLLLRPLARSSSWTLCCSPGLRPVDVAANADPVRGLAAGVRQGRETHLDPEGGPVLAVMEQLGEDRLAGQEPFLHAVALGPRGVGPWRRRRTAAQRLGLGVAGQGREGGIDVDDARAGLLKGLGFGDQDGIAGMNGRR